MCCHCCDCKKVTMEIKPFPIGDPEVAQAFADAVEKMLDAGQDPR